MCRAAPAAARIEPVPSTSQKDRMLRILFLIFLVFLLARAGIWLVQKLHDRLGIGRSFRRMMADGELDASVYEGTRWRTVERFGRKRLHSRIAPEQQRAIRAAKLAARDAFLDSTRPGFYQYLIIFLIASVLGLILETVFTLLTMGILQSRVGLVWGPFSPLYGCGAVLLTMVLWPLRKRPWWWSFLLGAVVGGLLEQLTGWGMEHFMHAVSWSYLHLPDHITQWVAWRFLIMWGVLGAAWCKLIMPELIYRIGEPTTTRQMVVVSLLTAFMALDILMTLMCFYRAAQRMHHVPPTNPFEVYVDTHFDDRFMADTFENMDFNFKPPTHIEMGGL